ncbi:MAG TPA: phosphatidate cytidylyltransferase [Propionibacteriaceae bacterium]|nr:phosphatidate cytidylyltransferase [Propionibacteriaceae bacterium]
MTTQPAPTPTGRAGRDLPAAIGVAVVLLAMFVTTLAWFNWGFVILVAIALALGAVEVHHALQRIGMSSAIVPIVIGTVAIIIGSYLAGQLEQDTIPSNTLLLAALGLTVLASLIWRMPGGSENFVKDAAASLFIIAYIPLMGAFAALMLAGDLGRERILTLLLCVIASDIGGYAVGVLFGKHPMAPKISPKKTWEGLAGSVGFGTIVGVVCAVYLLHVSPWVGVVLGLALVAFGACGDLIESLIKRDVGIKDMSSFLPGHGGVMDRLDSLLIAAPVAWLLMYLMVPGG